MKKLFYIAFALGLASCSTADHDELVSSPKSAPETYSSHRITQDEAVSLATSFRNNSQTLSRSGDTDESDVENVVVVRWEDLYPGVPNPIIGNEDPTSRSGDIFPQVKPTKVDTLFYVVNNKNNAGYTVVAADDRTEPIYIVTDHGNYHAGDWNSTKLGNGCVQIVDRAVETIIQDMGLRLVEYREELIDDSNLPIVLPMLKTTWGSYSSTGLNSNEYLPDSIRYKVTERSTLAVATAQILSYRFIIPKNYPWELDWNLILSEYDYNNILGLPTSDKTKRQVADLINYLETSLNNENWVSPLSESDNMEAMEWFKDKNLLADGFLYCDMHKVIESINKGNLVCASVSTQLGRRYLVMDGYYTKYYYYYSYPTEKRKISYMPHCNWGLNGNFNGYFLARLFDPSYFDKTENQDELPYSFGFDKCKYTVINCK